MFLRKRGRRSGRNVDPSAWEAAIEHCLLLKCILYITYSLYPLLWEKHSMYSGFWFIMEGRDLEAFSNYL